MCEVRTRAMRFVKAHGAGNDFILLPDPHDRVRLTAGLARSLCDRHRGLGGDGVIRVGSARDAATADVFMDYRNADGSLSEMCGNGIRCVAKYVLDRSPAGDTLRVDTRAGVKGVSVADRNADGTVAALTVDMGAPVPGKTGLVLDVAGTTVEVTTLSMGNPHAVIVVEDVERAPVERLGPALARHAAFPDGTNVEFLRVVARDLVRGRIWERGVGETLASGSGASAMAAAAILLGLTDRRVGVDVPGGRLHVDWTGESLSITGPAVEVASGELDSRWLERESEA